MVCLCILFPPTVIDGRPIVTLEHSEIVKQTEEWRNALVLYVIGETPNFSYMSSYIARNWNSVAAPDIYLHDDGFYIVKFKNIHDRDEILYSGLYTINSMPMILKVWSSDFDFKQEFPRTMPLWIRFPNLPLNCWSSVTLKQNC